MLTDRYISIVIACYRDAGNVEEMYRRLTEAMTHVSPHYELIWVNDNSPDNAEELLKALAARDERVTVISHSRNFGSQMAFTSGMEQSLGEAVILMDGDLQDPPELIPELVARWKEGFDVVYARRKARQGESTFKRASAFAFYRFIRLIATVAVPPDTGDFRLLSRRAADALRALRERRRFLRGLVAWTGFRQTSVLYDRPSRAVGESKYSLGAMVRLAMTATFSFSSFPITLVGLAGAAVCAGSLLALGLGVAVGTAALFFLGGVQLVALWILGQYLTGIAEEVKRRPLYVIQEAVNVQSSPARDA